MRDQLVNLRAIDPWNIIGWIILGIALAWALYFAGVALLSGANYLRATLMVWRRHFRTRNTPPAVDQRWWDPLSNCGYIIYAIHDNGIISIRSGSSSWGETPEQWRERVRSRRMYLTETAAGRVRP